MAGLDILGTAAVCPAAGYPMVTLLLTAIAPLAEVVVGPLYEGGT